MKACTKCNIVKSLDDFHNCKSKKSGKMSHCKDCRNLYNKNKAHEIGYDVLYQQALQRNPDRIKRNSIEYYQKNKVKLIERTRLARIKDPTIRKKEYENNKDCIKKKSKEWSENNKSKRRAIALNYQKRFYSNPDNKPIVMCRKLLSRVLILTGKSKTTKTESLLGYTQCQLKERMELMFKDGMSWANHGDWHIDHIKPITSFISEGIIDPKIINSLDNLQPLWAFDNLSKGCKYDS